MTTTTTPGADTAALSQYLSDCQLNCVTVNVDQALTMIAGILAGLAAPAAAAAPALTLVNPA